MDKQKNSAKKIDSEIEEVLAACNGGGTLEWRDIQGSLMESLADQFRVMAEASTGNDFYMSFCRSLVKRTHHRFGIEGGPSNVAKFREFLHWMAEDIMPQSSSSQFQLDALPEYLDEFFRREP